MESTQSIHRIRRKAIQSTLSPKHEPSSTATPLLELGDTTLVPQGWPTSPSRIKHPLSTILAHRAFDIALFAFSVCFLVFAMAVIHYNQAPISNNSTATRVLTTATKYGPTVFPLLFASVVGRTTHAILLWRLEKGERIEILDTLATSTSLTSTVTSQLHLRQISVLSVVLVVIWALSPIGGQASIRQMSVQSAIITTPSTFRYAVPAWKFASIGFTSLRPSVDNLYTGALSASTKTKKSPVDAWGNVKIPRLEHYENKTVPDNDGWFNLSVDDNDDLAKYPSHMGIPMDGIENGTTTTDYEMHLQTMYIQTTCTSSNKTETFQDYGELPSNTRNVTGYGGLIWWSEDQRRARYSETLDTLQPMNINYISSSNDPRELLCALTSSYVEAAVSCAVNSTCRVTKLRRSQVPHLPSAFTILSIQDDNTYSGNWEIFVQAFILSFGIEEPRGSSAGDDNLVDRYLRDPSLEIINPWGASAEVNRTWPSDEDFSARFGQLLNTYVASINNLFTISSGMGSDNSYSWDKNATFVPPRISGLQGNGSWSIYNWTGREDDYAKSKVWSSEGFKHEHVKVIVAHKPWAITLSIASLVLIAFSLITPLIRHCLTTGPDIAMNFSSLATRNNSHVPIPASGSFLPAADRFRLLKDMRLRFADAKSKSDVGNLVIAAQSVETLGNSRIRKGRLYE